MKKNFKKFFREAKKRLVLHIYYIRVRARTCIDKRKSKNLSIKLRVFKENNNKVVLIRGRLYDDDELMGRNKQQKMNGEQQQRVKNFVLA